MQLLFYSPLTKELSEVLNVSLDVFLLYIKLKLEEKFPKLNLLESISLLDDTRKSVTNVTIQKYFQKAELKNNCTDKNSTNLDSKDEKDLLLSKWLEKENLIPIKTSSLDNFFTVDSEVETTILLMEEEILENIHKNNQDNVDNECENLPEMQM